MTTMIKGFGFDATTHEMWLGNMRCRLSPQMTAMFKPLFAKFNRVVSIEDLVEAIYGSDSKRPDHPGKVVHAQADRIRDRLGRIGAPLTLRFISGGFALMPKTAARADGVSGRISSGSPTGR